MYQSGTVPEVLASIPSSQVKLTNEILVKSTKGQCQYWNHQSGSNFRLFLVRSRSRKFQAAATGRPSNPRETLARPSDHPGSSVAQQFCIPFSFCMPCCLASKSHLGSPPSRRSRVSPAPGATNQEHSGQQMKSECWSRSSQHRSSEANCSKNFSKPARGARQAQSSSP